MKDLVQEMSDWLISAGNGIGLENPDPAWAIKTTDTTAYLYKDGLPSLWMDLKTFEQLAKPTK